ncbi:MAG TPA: DUF4105 domain-containing protein [Gammaproteobacteria bacterium]|nr:DUF4105 domain-containing protein [Gammaproteobacteria bacterium]
MRIGRLLQRFAIVPLAPVAIWGVLVLLFADILPRPWRVAAAIAFGLSGLFAALALWRARGRLLALACFAFALGGAIAGWCSIVPSNARDWQPEVATLAHASIEGDRITVHNIRNFDYRSETDSTPRYYDRTFDLNELASVDLLAVYWMGPAIAHTMLSFGFTDGNHLAISIETRKERGEGYSTLLGFFRQYELYYVVADERDVVRLRTTYRDPQEEIYLYRVQGPLANGRRLFLAYMQRLNSLAEKPEFYNTLADNCTTGVWLNTLVNESHLKLSWKLLASGHTPEYLYENGRLDQRLPFAELRARSLINARAQAADQAADFSQRIRAGLPDGGP